jgi:hypothetical protein
MQRHQVDFLGKGKQNNLSNFKFSLSVILIDVMPNCFIKSINFSGSDSFWWLQNIFWQKKTVELVIALGITLILSQVFSHYGSNL